MKNATRSFAVTATFLVAFLATSLIVGADDGLNGPFGPASVRAALTRMVTKDTTQTITAVKTFTAIPSFPAGIYIPATAASTYGIYVDLEGAGSTAGYFYSVGDGISSYSGTGNALFGSGSAANANPTIVSYQAAGQAATVKALDVQNSSNVTKASLDFNGALRLSGQTATVTMGAGAPGGACVSGSLYLRTDGDAATTVYACAATVWGAR